MKQSFNLLFVPVMNLLMIIGIVCFSTNAMAQGSILHLAQPGYYRMQIGDIEVTALSDGTVPQNFHQLLTNVKPGEIDQLLKLNYQTDPVELSVNAFLLKVEGKLILIDAGTAGAYGPTLGHLSESLLRAGYKTEQIDAVLITHINF